VCAFSRYFQYWKFAKRKFLIQKEAKEYEGKGSRRRAEQKPQTKSLENDHKTTYVSGLVFLFSGLKVE
jgi:hypothetical protein